MAIAPALKQKRAAQRKAARARSKMLEELADEFLEQEARVRETLDKSGRRIRTAHIQSRLDEMDASVALHRHLGSGGHMGRRLPSLDDYDRTDERLTTEDE